MASIRERPRKDGTTYAVLFTVDGRHSSVPFKGQPSAEKSRQLVDLVGGNRAMETYDIDERRRSDNFAGVCPSLSIWTGTSPACRASRRRLGRGRELRPSRSGGHRLSTEWSCFPSRSRSGSGRWWLLIPSLPKSGSGRHVPAVLVGFHAV